MSHYNCCVPGCTNSFRNASHLHFYRIPKDESLRRTYKVILKNKSLKLESTSTRICSEHFEGGEKLSRCHLPSLFPWTKQEKKRRELLKRVSFEETQAAEEAKRLKRQQQQQEQSQKVSQQHNEHHDNQAQSSIKYIDINSLLKDFQSHKLNIDKLKDEKTKLQSEIEKLKEENAKLLEANQKLEGETKRLRHSLENVRFDIDKYKHSNEDIAFYTGFPDFNAMLLCFKVVEESANNIVYENHRVSTGNVGRPRSLSKWQEFTLVLMRLRLGLFEKDLAHRFNISRSTVSKITNGWLKCMRGVFEPLIRIPPRPVIKLHMPEVFKTFYPKCAVIVDCTEFEMEKPSSLDSQSACYSSYKSRTTMKALLGITPSGALCFVSNLFPGSTSDKEITAQSGFLDKLLPGDMVMADKGFNCLDELVSVGADLIRPSFLEKNTQFSKQETNHNKVVASLRVHVERLMERIKNWHIFDRRIPITMASVSSDILFVVSGLSNFHPPLIN